MDDGNELSIALISLLRGVVYRDSDTAKWQALTKRKNRVQDYLSVLGLELKLFEEDGFAYLSNQTELAEQDDIPRLINRRPLPYVTSLTLALLRRKLAEHDARSGDERLILDREEIVETVQTFLPAGTNEAREVDQINRAIRRIAELGFVRFLNTDRDKVEVMRIIAAFVDAQWLNEFDQRLRDYLDYGGAGGAGAESEWGSAGGDDRDGDSR